LDTGGKADGARQEMKFEQAAIAVQDKLGYAELQARIDAAFDARDVEVFLSRMGRSKLRIRNFEGALQRGLMGKEAAGLYKELPVSDQALIRERYLQQVEAVLPELRQRYLKVYAYY
jgi:hypothetical protein